MSVEFATAFVIVGVVFCLAARDVVLRIFEARQAEREDKRYEEARKFMELVEQRVEKLDKRVTNAEANRRRP